MTDLEKQELFNKVFLSFNANGIFINADQVLGDTSFIEKHYRNEWLKHCWQRNISFIAGTLRELWWNTFRIANRYCIIGVFTKVCI